MNDSTEPKRTHLGLVGRLAFMAACMFAFGFALVPLYDVMCRITGIGGRTANAAETVDLSRPDMNRVVTVEFVAMVNEQAPWEFRPVVASMEVHPGQLYDTAYFAKNLTDLPLVGQAVPSVAPGEAAKHFKKVECFCFTEQRFVAHEGRDMGVRFMVDPDLPTFIDRVTLSYTFFVNRQATAAPAGIPARS